MEVESVRGRVVIATASRRGGQQTRHEDPDRGQDGQRRQAHPQRLDPCIGELTVPSGTAISGSP